MKYYPEHQYYCLQSDISNSCHNLLAYAAGRPGDTILGLTALHRTNHVRAKPYPICVNRTGNQTGFNKLTSEPFNNFHPLHPYR